MSEFVWGKTAYESYREYWINTGFLIGLTLLEWDDLPEREQEAWSSVAMSIRKASHV